MFRPIDLQVVIVKGVDNAQNMSYSQQMMDTSQQNLATKESQKNSLNAKKVMSREEFQNPNARTSTDSNGNPSYSSYGMKKKKKTESVDPYRGKVIDLRL